MSMISQDPLPSSEFKEEFVRMLEAMDPEVKKFLGGWHPGLKEVLQITSPNQMGRLQETDLLIQPSISKILEQHSVRNDTGGFIDPFEKK